MECLQRFNGHKIGMDVLKIRFAKPSNNADSGDHSESKRRSSTRLDTQGNIENIENALNSSKLKQKYCRDFDSDNETVYSTKSGGRGQVVNALRETREYYK